MTGTMTDTLQSPAGELTAQDPADVTAAWLADLAAMLESGSAAAIEELFTEEATWRDFMAFSWDFSHSIGRDSLAARLLELAKAADLDNLEVNTAQPPVLLEHDHIRAFFDFTTRDRTDRGYVLLVPGPDRYLATTVQTQVIALQNYPERIGHHRRDGKTYGVVL